MRTAHLSLSGLLVITLACGGEEPPAHTAHAVAPPITTVAPAPSVAPTGEKTAPLYAGHGAESVPKEVLAKFQAPALPSQVSRRIEAMLDVRGPGGGVLTPDGKTLYFSWNVTGSSQVWKLGAPNAWPTQVTGGEDATRIAAITPDGKYVVLSRDRKGEENPGVYLYDARAGGALREVQHKKGIQTRLEFVSDDSKYLYYASNDRKVDSYAIYRHDLETKKSELVFGEDGLWRVADHKPGKLLLAKSTGALTSEFSEWDEAKKVLTPVLGQGENEEYHAFFAKGDGLIVRTPKLPDGKPGEFRRLYLVKGTTWKAISPEVKADVASAGADHERKRLYYTLNENGSTRARAMDGATYAEVKMPDFPDAAHVSPGFASRDGRYVTVTVGRHKGPSVMYVHDWTAKKTTSWFSPSAPEIDTTKFVAAELESYPARDGTKIPMFVRRPANCAKPCPVVVHFHGGPEGQSVTGFNAYGQLFVDAGFIFVDPNVRGSDGYGRSWLHSDDGAKRLQVITDIEDASKYIRSAWAHEGKAPKVGVMGGSYGGYSTLVAMSMFSGAYDAGVANVGMSSLLSFLENTAPYRRALRISEYGDPVKDREALLKLSPVTYIEKVSAPLMLIQGASDPRVPVGEAIQMHARLEKRGLPTPMIIFPDEGHGAQKRSNKVLEVGHTLAFFEKHLLGKAE